MVSPSIRFLDAPEIERILDEARQLLLDPGLVIHSRRCLQILAEAGAAVEWDRHLARLPASLLEGALASAPSGFSLYDLAGEPRLALGGDSVYYHPASTAATILDARTGHIRPPVTADLVEYIHVVEALPEIDAQSSALRCQDVPDEIADSYRVYLLLKHATKPFFTGAFSLAGQRLEIELLSAFAGGGPALAQRPVAIMAVCPSSPLRWGDFPADSLILCAEAGVPVSLVSMPLAGATAPVTLAGTLVQLAAETLSGFVLAQVVRPGAPVLWGGVPTIFDMREGTTPVGAVESLMMSCAFNEIGKHLGLPTHCYLGNSDAKTVDGQAAYESALGLTLAALSRANLNAGAGMLSFVNCQSLEDLVIDHELIGMARRMARGIDTAPDSLAAEVIREVGHGGNFVMAAHTLRRFRQEFFVPRLASRESDAGWQRQGAREIRQLARERLAELAASCHDTPLTGGRAQALDDIMAHAARQVGMEELPTA